jgi:tetratricopeptide (TPR) repeat protein
LEFYLLAPGLLGGDTKKAEAVAARIAAIDRGEGFLAQARVAAFRKDYRQAEELTRKAAEASPSSYNAVMALARFHMDPQRRNENAAEDTARKALTIEPARVDAYAILASILAGRNDWNGLESLLSNALSLVPDDLAPFYRAAERLVSAGVQQDRAERYLRRYLAQEPEGNQPTLADARWLLGLTLEAQGSRDAAVQQWTQALQQDPSSPAALELKRVRRAPNPSRNGGNLRP